MPNKGYKKLLALLCAAAMSVSILPCAAFADTVEIETADDVLYSATEVISEDFDSAVDSYWTTQNNTGNLSAVAVVDNYLKVTSHNNGARSGYITLGSNTGAAKTVEVKFDVKAVNWNRASTDDNPHGVAIGDKSGKAIFTLLFPNARDAARNVTLNGTALNNVVQQYRTDGAWYTVDAILDFESQSFSYNIYAQGSESTALESGTGTMQSQATEVGTVCFYTNRTNSAADYVAIDNFYIAEIDIPVITPASDLELFAGDVKPIATVTNTDDLDISVDIEGSDFELYSVENGVVYVKAVQNGTGGQTTVKITAYGDVKVEKDIVLTYATDETLVASAKAALDIAKDNENVTVNGDAYDVVGNFELPESINSAQITWSATVDGEVNENIIKIDGNKVIVGIIDGDPEVVLKALITKGEASDTREFKLNLPTVAQKLEAMVNAIELSGADVVKNDDGTYNVKGEFTVPVSDPEVPQVSYLWSTTDADKLSVSGEKVSPLSYGGASVTLKVTGSYEGTEASAEAEFTLILDRTTVYYDEDFEDWSAATIVYNDHSSDQTKTIGDWTFVAPARTNGGNDKISIAENASSKMLNMSTEFVQIYAKLDKAPESDAIKENMVMKARMQFSAEGTYLIVSDGTTSRGVSYIEFSASEFGLEKNVLYNVELALNGSSAVIVIYVDKDGNGEYNTGDTLVYFNPEYKTALKTISRIEPNIHRDNGAASNTYLDNLYLADTTYTLSPEIAAQAAINDINIPANNKNAVTASEEDDAFTAYNNFTLPTSAYGIDIAWTSDNEHIVINGATAVVKPEAGYSGPVTLTATASYGEGKAISKNYKVTLHDPDEELKAAEVTKLNLLDYAKTGSVSIDLTDAETPVMYDLSLPKGSGNIEMSWTSSDANVYSISADGTSASIMLSDKDAKTVTLKNTVSYVKDGQVIASKVYEYPITVQFNPEAAEAKAKAAAEEMARLQNEKDENSTATADDYIGELMKNLLYKYQVRFDAEYAGNFSKIPATVPTSTTYFDITQTGNFGSSIAYSSSSTALKISASSSRVNVTHPSSTVSAALTATISAATAEAQTKSFTVSVAGTGSTGGSVGGGNSGSNNTTTVPGTASTPTPPQKPQPVDPNNAFDDIDGVRDWAGDAIARLYKAGIISGKADRVFEPYAAVTRAEFVKMVVGTIGINSSIVSENRSFTDLPANHWAFEYVQIAVAAGIINGYDNDTFGTNDNITRQDMAVIVKRAADYAQINLPEVNEQLSFTDSASISEYASDAVSALQRANIINGGDNGSFDPFGAANRAQAAKVLAADVFWN